MTQRINARNDGVKTNESLETGSTYGDTSLDGTSVGIGYHKELDNTLFIRVDGQYMSFDGVTLSSLDNTLNLKNLNGVTATLSVGKSF